LFSNSGPVLDSAAFDRYIVNHMTNRRSQRNRISLQHVGESCATAAEGCFAVLNSIDLEITHGQFAVRIGKSGSGKSVLLNSIDGIESSAETQRRKRMNRIQLVAIGTMLMFALTTAAQQTTTRPGGPAKGVSGDGGVQAVEKQLKVLTEKLDLTGDQQAKIKTILQKLHDATQQLTQNESMSREERLGKVRACLYKADKEIREVLNDDQKKRLDQVEQEPHPELHENLNGATPPSPRALQS